MWNWTMLVVGTGLGIVAVTADLIGIGASPGFGLRQGVVAVLALGLIVLSALRIVRRERR